MKVIVVQEEEEEEEVVLSLCNMGMSKLVRMYVCACKTFSYVSTCNTCAHICKCDQSCSPFSCLFNMEALVLY